jgi:tetratricopeptide (TPR) repeat protein
MSYKKVKELRQAGKLDEALLLAIETLEANPNDIWNKRSLAWVYYALLKSNSKSNDFPLMIDYLLKIKELELPNDEKMIFDNCAWTIGSFLFAANKTGNVDISKVMSLHNAIKEFSFTKPSESYSFLFKAFHKILSQSYSYVEVADWWNFENFREEDFENEIVNDKMNISFVESSYVHYAKILLDGKPTNSEWNNKIIDKEKLQVFLQKLDVLISQHPKYQYPPYYKAKILMTLGNGENVLSVFLPFAKQKRNDFWVWELLGSIVEENADLKFACYCKALLLNSPDEFLIKLRQNLVPMLLSREFFAEAKTEIEKIITVREKNKWKISNEIINWKAQEWFIDAKVKKNNRDLYLKYYKEAEDLLYSDIEEEIVVVDFVNENKKMLNFVKNESVAGFFKYENHLTKPYIGQFLKVRFNGNNKEMFYKVLTVRDANVDVSDSNLVKEVEGELKIRELQNFGFLGDVFIDHKMIEKNKLNHGQKIRIRAVKSYNNVKKNIGWKCIEIIKT